MAKEFIAARDDDCEMTSFISPKVKYDYCMSGRISGMTAQQVRALHRVMWRVFPELNNYFTTSKMMFNYLVEMGYPLWSQMGGTPYPLIEKANKLRLPFNQVVASQDCDYVTQDSDKMNQICPVVYNAPIISLHKATMVPNTENVCDHLSYASAAKKNKGQLCIDDGLGKVSGLKTIQQRTQNIVLFFHGNSDGDFYPGLYVAKQRGLVFIHNNASVCEAINKEVPNSCVNVLDADTEVNQSLNSPMDDIYVIAAREEGLASQRASHDTTPRP